MTRGDYYTSVDQALGSERVDALARTNSEIDKLNAVVSHAVTLDSIMFPISHGKSEQLRTMIKPTERWGDLTQANGDHLCIDKISHVGLQNIFDAAVFPELHMRLISWWICHAWRLLDLARTAIQSLEDWNLAVAALCSRGLIEQVGCLLSESKEISRLWAEAKDLDGKMLEGTDRVDVVRSRLHEPLGKYAFAAADWVNRKNSKPPTSRPMSVSWPKCQISISGKCMIGSRMRRTPQWAHGQCMRINQFATPRVRSCCAVTHYDRHLWKAAMTASGSA